MHPRLQSGAFARPLNFTVSRHATLSHCCARRLFWVIGYGLEVPRFASRSHSAGSQIGRETLSSRKGDVLKTFLWRLAEGIAVVLLLALWIRGSIALRYALAAVATIGFLIQTYVFRLRPMFARGATQKERAILFALSVTGAFSLGYLLLWSARQGHAG